MTMDNEILNEFIFSEESFEECPDQELEIKRFLLEKNLLTGDWLTRKFDKPAFIKEAAKVLKHGKASGLLNKETRVFVYAGDDNSCSLCGNAAWEPYQNYVSVHLVYSCESPRLTCLKCIMEEI
jgi:hypothetical protein